MKKIKLKYSWLAILFIGLVACDVDNTLPEIQNNANEKTIALTTDGLDFSKYIAVGASFTSGFTDNALFKVGQENSFPNILSKKFSMANGGEFNQPLTNDNIGGLLFRGNVIQNPRLYFNGTKPTILNATPTTEITNKVTGELNNFGVPGAKSFHLLAAGYGNLQGVPVGKANPYFARFASSPNATIINDAVSKSPTFFTLSEIGGNDILSYAVTGGNGTYQKGNYDPASYGNNDITDPNVFAQAFSGIVDALTANGAKGVITTVPYITSLSHFTTVPHNPLNPTTNEAFASQIPTLNAVYGVLNKVYTALGQTNRIVKFTADKASPVVIVDENLPDLSKQIAGALLQSGPAFEGFVTQFGLPAQTAPKVAELLGYFYGQARPATKNDLLVLPSSAIIGTVDKTAVAYLMQQGLPQALAGQFSVEGITKPLTDKWVLTPEEQANIKEATDAYNTTIMAIAETKGLALVDLKEILERASTTGIMFDEYNMNTSLVTGGLISLDGIHLTARGYALMANEILKAIDTKYGSNFAKATNGLAKAGEYPTNYSPLLQ